MRGTASAQAEGQPRTAWSRRCVALILAVIEVANAQMNEGEDKQPLLFEEKPPQRSKLPTERSQVLIRKATPKEVETHSEYMQRLRHGQPHCRED